ncbi:MAG: hypothetical protein AAFZ65_05920, partial [Planctomycetota bacterium]
LGYFQRVADVPAAADRTPGLDLVRRTTGGGAIHHARELTFSIAASLEHPLYAGPIANSYRRVHALIAEALAEFGVDATPRGEQPAASDRDGTGMCFHASHPLDLGWGEDWRKGVGSAQRRKHGRVLHHGSIKLAPDPLEPGVATPWTLPSPHDVGAALVDVLAGGLEQDPEPWELNADARAAVNHTHRAMFRDEAFVLRR